MPTTLTLFIQPLVIFVPALLWLIGLTPLVMRAGCCCQFMPKRVPVPNVTRLLALKAKSHCPRGKPEAALARELGIDYACLAVVANWAAGCDPDPHPVTLQEVQMHVRAAGAGIAPLLRALLEAG